MKYVVWLVLCLLLVLSSCKTQEQMFITGTGDINNNYILEAWYLDENTGTVAIGNKSVANLTLVNSNMWRETGYNGSMIYLNISQNAKLQLGSLPQVLSPSEYTQQLWCFRLYWLEPANSTNSKNVIAIGEDNRFIFDNYPQVSPPFIRWRIDNETSNSANANFQGNNNYAVNQWTSYCLGYNTTHNFFYSNGVLNSTGSLTSGKKFNFTGQTLRIGEGPFNGGDIEAYVDEIVIFNQSTQAVVDYYESLGYKGGTSNSPPTTPTNLTVNGTTNFNTTYSGTISMQCSGSTDADNDTITYEIWKGQTTKSPAFVATNTFITQDSDTGNDTITASGENCGSECKEDLFDRNTNTKWLTFAKTGWIQIKLGNGAKSSLSYNITTANDVNGRDPNNWTIEGSNDNSTWYLLDVKTNQATIFTSRSTTYSFTMSQPTNDSYLYYRWNISEVRDPSLNILQVAELWLIQSEEQNISSTNWTTIGNHTTSAYEWDTSSLIGQNYTDFRCRAIDIDGTNTWSSYYEKTNVLLQITSGASNSCTYTSGTWNIQCGDGCNITSNVNLNDNNVIFNGTGTVTLTANLTNVGNTTIQGGCNLIRKNGGGIIR